jgi:hypothetical protein
MEGSSKSVKVGGRGWCFVNIHLLVQKLLVGDEAHKYRAYKVISFMLCTNTTICNLQFLTVYYTRTSYSSAIIMDLRYSQNYKTTAVQILRLSTNNPIFLNLFLSFLYCKLTFRYQFPFSFYLNRIVKPDRSVSLLCLFLCVCVYVLYMAHPTSFWNKHVQKKNTQNVFRQNQPTASSVPMWALRSWEGRPKKDMQMYNHRLNKMNKQVCWHIGQSHRKTY